MIVLLRNPELSQQLKHILPKREELLVWIDSLTEITFLQQTIEAQRRSRSSKSEVKSSETNEDERIERVIKKIGDLIERVANEEIIIQELSGNIEALRENIDIIRATVLRESVTGSNGGELIRDEIHI